MRDPSCGACIHYEEAAKHRQTRTNPAPAKPPGGHSLIELDPAVGDAVDDALALGQEGRTEAAMAAMQRLAREHPRDHLVCFGMGTLLEISGRHEESIDWFELAIEVCPDFAEAYYNKAVAHKNLRDIAAAIRCYRKVVEHGEPGEPEVEESRSLLADLAESIRRTEGIGLDTYLDSMDEFNRAVALMAEGRWEAAVDGFRAAIALNGRNAPSHGNLGLCHAYLGNKDLALAELDRALDIDPEYEPARANRKVVARMRDGERLGSRNMEILDFALEKLRMLKKKGIRIS